MSLKFANEIKKKKSSSADKKVLCQRHFANPIFVHLWSIQQVPHAVT